MQDFTICAWLSISPENKGYVFYENKLNSEEDQEYRKFLSIEASQELGITILDGETEIPDSVFYLKFNVRINKTILSYSAKTYSDIIARSGNKVFISISYNWDSPLKMYYSVYPCEGMPELIQVENFRENSVGDGDEVVFSEEEILWGHLLDEEISYNELFNRVLTRSEINDAMVNNIPECTEPLYPPVFTLQPVAQNINAGEDLILTVDATGAPVITYQWYVDGDEMFDSGNVSGAHTATLTITAADGSSTGLYYCIATNGYGSTYSDEAYCTVVDSPIFEAPPFYQSDFAYSSALEIDWGNPSQVGFIGTVDSEYIYREIQTYNFHGEVSYITGPEESDTFNHDHYRIQGCGLAFGNPSFGNSDWEAVTFYAEDADGVNNNRFRIVDRFNTVLYASGLYDATIPYGVTVTWDVNSYYDEFDEFHQDLTIHLEVPSLGIDESRVIVDWSNNGIAKFVVNGPFYTDHEPRMVLNHYKTIEYS